MPWKTYFASFLPYCKFRILSEVNNLKIKNLRTREIIELTPQQKQQIIEKLNSQKSQIKFSVLKKLISTKNISYVGADFEFNLQSERREGLDANPTESLLKNEKSLLPLQRLDTMKIIEVSIGDAKENLFSSHPRVFLDITQTGMVSCPYCGTTYKLK